MGRPIKIAKYQGAIPVDTGYNNPDGALNTYGVVGGKTGLTGNQILCQVKLPSLAVGAGYIIRQRSATKFLAAKASAIQDENIVAGVTYVITLLGTTDWEALGAGPNASEGDVFTAIINGTGLTTTGQVNQCGVCVLVDLANPSSDNTMSVTITKADTTTARLAKIATSFGLDYSNNPYVLSFNAAAGADPSNGQPYPVAQVASL